jgi:2Fe-2S ferredoxin
MPQVTFVQYDGTKHVVAAEEGMSVMEVAVRNGVPGINADCGGACACGTCHVYTSPEWAEVLGVPLEDEEAMLEMVEERRPTSRLSCQMRIDANCEGLVIDMPASQHPV